MNSVLLDRVHDGRLDTLFCETERIINSRPLTPISDDSSDLDVLTPNMLLPLLPSVAIPQGGFVKRDIYRFRWRHCQYVAAQF